MAIANLWLNQSYRTIDFGSNNFSKINFTSPKAFQIGNFLIFNPEETK
jgi:hypothetical protein